MEHLDSVTLIPAGIVVIFVVFLVMKAFGKNTPTYVEDEGGDTDKAEDPIYENDDLWDSDGESADINRIDYDACKRCQLDCSIRKADYVE